MSQSGSHQSAPQVTGRSNKEHGIIVLIPIVGPWDEDVRSLFYGGADGFAIELVTQDNRRYFKLTPQIDDKTAVSKCLMALLPSTVVRALMEAWRSGTSRYVTAQQADIECITRRFARCCNLPARPVTPANPYQRLLQMTGPGGVIRAARGYRLTVRGDHNPATA